MRERAEAHLEAVERKRARLAEIAEKLRELITACPGHGATHECAILDALAGGREGGLDAADRLADAADRLADAADRLADAGGSSIELHVEGMACGGCAAKVRSVLRRSPGVRDVTVDRVSRRAHVRIDAAATDGDTLACCLTDAGFPTRFA